MICICLLSNSKQYFYHSSSSRFSTFIFLRTSFVKNCVNVVLVYVLCRILSMVGGCSCGQADSIFLYFLQNAGGRLTDFISFYHLPSTVVRHPVHKLLRAAYSFYNVSTETSLKDLMYDALILAKKVREKKNSFLFGCWNLSCKYYGSIAMIGLHTVPGKGEIPQKLHSPPWELFPDSNVYNRLMKYLQQDWNIQIN